MDSWPSHGKADAPSILTKKKQSAIESVSYPLVAQGGPNYLTLVERNGRFEWTSVFKGEDIHKMRTGKGLIAFPPTCPPPLVLPHLSLKQHAEQGANFIRTYHPDLDIPAELIREQLTDATQYTNNLHSFDPFAGNLIEGIVVRGSYGRKHVYVAFPMGGLRNGLNLSPLVYSDAGELTFVPSANPTRNFRTPIQQVVAAQAGDVQDRNYPSDRGPYFAVRTHGGMTLLKAESRDDSKLSLSDLAALAASDLGGRAIQDVKPTSELDVCIVDDCGTVFHMNYGQGHTVLNTIFRVSETDADGDIWRVALGARQYEKVVMSGTSAHLLDLRATSALTLFTSSVLNDKLTSLENVGPDGIMRLCTTDQILWIDKRCPNKPLLGLKHGRNRDPTLRTVTIKFDQRLMTFLTSGRNSLATVYDVSRLDGFPLTVHNPPYCLLLSTSHDEKNTSQLFFRHPHQLGDTCCTVFQMCDRGSLNCLDLSLSAQEGTNTKVEWLDDVKALDSESNIRYEDVGAVGIRDKTEVDFSPTYEYLFSHYEEDREKSEEKEAESLYEVIEQAPLFWQKVDITEEQVLTAYDILFRTGEEPRKIAQADFLSESVVNSVRGYRALMQGRLTSAMLGKGAAWHYDISPTLRHFIPEATQDIEELANHLSQFNLHQSDRSYKSIQREIRAREQLALDMVLASSIYSNQPISGSKRTEDNLESLTRALSLANETPIQFGYLQPVKQKNDQAEHAEDSIGAIGATSGVRMLLKEWNIGADPEFGHVYRAPSHGTDSHGTTQSKAQAKTRSIVRPPAVAVSNIPATSIPDSTTRGARHEEVHSQDFSSVTHAATGDLQEVLASTQVVAGPYGGRNKLGKKRAGKRRLGGF
ncbi:hypothetical protein APHAL10511_001102 [Amanita phalloides]|nr:hypothetical protein APHAL10511_001102 [Amanita phalloides]